MRSIVCAVAAALLLTPMAALADQPQASPRAAAAKSTAAKSTKIKPVPTQTADAQPQQAPFYPRWEVPSITISGLTVWTFRPGHFQGQ